MLLDSFMNSEKLKHYNFKKIQTHARFSFDTFIIIEKDSVLRGKCDLITKAKHKWLKLGDYSHCEDLRNN